MSSTENGKKKKSKSTDDSENAKKKKKNEAVEDVPVLDIFYPDILIDIKTDKCAMCKGNHESLDSVDVAANLRSIHELDCCKCEGLCDDVTQCACLAQGRNYTFTGGLIPGTHARILECNLRCSCSIRRCTNRVVEKGPTARLEVFRVRNDLPTEGPVSINGVVGASAANKSKNNTWGVRTLDFIPESAFVCEITGQYVLGKSVNNQGEGTVTDLILSSNNSRASSSSNGRSARRTYTTKITPVGAWEEGEENASFSSSSSTSSASYSTLDPALWAAQQAAQQALAAAGAEEDLALFEQARSHHAENILAENEDLVRQFLDGQLCIDSRRFGNVGSFIRRQPLPTESGRNNDKMLRRKLVYTSLRDDGQGPKLALFAARNIEADSELFL
eukprot:gene23392-26480_t